jgi:hypothetical protein
MIKIFEEFSDDSVIDESILTIENGMIKLWHYSNNKIENGVVSINTSANNHSYREYKSWGKARSFFYATAGGYLSDGIGRGHDYIYTCYIPLKEIYDINDNPDGYKHKSGEMFENSLLEFTRDRGYTSWVYNLGGQSKVPIIVSFIDVEISHAQKKTGRGYVDMDEDMTDYKIGEISFRQRGERKDKTWDVIQNGENLKSLTNTYLKRGRDVQKHFGSSSYLHHLIKFLPEYENDYDVEDEDEDEDY